MYCSMLQVPFNTHLSKKHCDIIHIQYRIMVRKQRRARISMIRKAKIFSSLSSYPSVNPNVHLQQALVII